MHDTTKAGVEMAVESIGLNLEANSVRKAIVAAARRVAERAGADALTPDAVAEEAGCTSDTVRADFADTGELQLAVVADGLSELAALMKRAAVGDGNVEQNDEAVAPAGISLKEIEQAIGVVLGGGLEDLGQDFAADTDDVPDAFPEDAVAEPATARPGRLKLSECDAPEYLPQNVQDNQSVAASIAELERGMARLEARPVDAWLERRLRVFERTLADIEARMEKLEYDSTAAHSAANDSFKTLEERVEAAVKSTDTRVEENERHQDELQLYVNDLSGRLSRVEVRRENFASERPAIAIPVMPEIEGQDGDNPQAPSESAEVADVPPPALHGPESYLDAARRAANCAAAAAAKPKRRRPIVIRFPRQVVLSLSRRTMRMITSLLGLVVLLFAAGVMLKGQEPAVAAVRPQALLLSPDARVVALARAHNPKAALIVGLKFLNGDGVASDLPSAAYWLGVAANGHEPVAEYWLATLYERGLGVPKDRALAMRWYEKAAEAGNTKAMYRLGVGYAEGWNGEPDYAEGGEWFDAAAKLGVVDAEYNLAVLYERGDGVVQSFSHAFTWYAIAAARGDAISKERLDTLASQLAPSDVEAAQKAAAAFVPATPKVVANIAPTVTAVAMLTPPR